MCAIAGILAKTNKLTTEELSHLTRNMTDQMHHRGPDDEGVWISPDGKCALGHRRLSIIDTSKNGHQPMVQDEHQAALSYNGELYNYKELKQELEQQAVVFSSLGDTEVVLQSIHHWGADAFDKMDGMYGLAYYDIQSGTLTLARDRFGEKPVYYCETDDYFAFSSELHALSILPNFDNRIDQKRIGLFLSFQYVPAPFTIYCGAEKLPPGHTLTVNVNCGEKVLKSYFEFKASSQQQSTSSIKDKAEELEELLVHAIDKRLVSDVPIGALLSGGVDSSTVVALIAKRLNRPIKTFSIGFEGSSYSEHEMAANIATKLDVEHICKTLTPDWTLRGGEIGAMLDEPNGDSSCLPTYALSEFAKKEVTVALSGDGGDEMFGGYGRYFSALEDEQKMHAGDQTIKMRGMGRQYYYHYLLMFPDHHLENFMGSIPEETLAFLNNLRQEITNDVRPLGNVLREMDASQYLPGAVLAKVDRMSMQHSLEVRTPFLSKEVSAFAAGLAADSCFSNGQGKLVLKAVAEKYLPRAWLDQPKKGFNIPGPDWRIPELLSSLETILMDNQCLLSTWIHQRYLSDYVQQMKVNPNPYQIWGVIILESWLRTHPWKPA